MPSACQSTHAVDVGHETLTTLKIWQCAHHSERGQAVQVRHGVPPRASHPQDLAHGPAALHDEVQGFLKQGLGKPSACSSTAQPY